MELIHELILFKASHHVGMHVFKDMSNNTMSSSSATCPKCGANQPSLKRRNSMAFSLRRKPVTWCLEHKGTPCHVFVSDKIPRYGAHHALCCPRSCTTPWSNPRFWTRKLGYTYLRQPWCSCPSSVSLPGCPTSFLPFMASVSALSLLWLLC